MRARCTWSRQRWQERGPLDEHAATVGEVDRDPCCKSGGAEPDDAQPVVLEVNYSPDYGKLLELRPSFLDDVFERLFLHTDAASNDTGHVLGAKVGASLWEQLPL